MNAPVKISDLTSQEMFLLEWLGKEDSSALGECEGQSLTVLVNLSLAQIGPAPEGRHPHYSRVSLTDKGWEVLTKRLNSVAQAARLAFRSLANLDLHPVPAINISPTVSDFGGQDNRKILALANICRKISDAHHAGPGYAHMVKPSDFAVLKEFVAFAEAEFELSAVAKRDDEVDQVHSRDESHYLDRERV